MPTVGFTPTLTRSANGPQARQVVGAGPMQQFNPSDSFGVAPIDPTAVARGIGQVGQGLSQLGVAVERFHLRVATTEAEEALVNFEREKNQLFFDPEKGYFNTQGRTAYDMAEGAVEGLTKLQQKYADALQSDEARQMFSTAASREMTRAQQDVMRHASTQFDAWETATIKARVENSLESAALYWDDPSRRSVSLELGRQSLVDVATKQGLGPEALAENLQTFNSQFATATIEAALGVSAQAGQRALLENRDMLEAPDILRVQTKVDARMATEIEQMQSSASIEIASALVGQFGDMANARTVISEQIADIADPELRSRASREAMTQLDNRLKAKSEAQAATFELAENFLMQGNTVDQFIAANPDGWELMTPAQKRKIKSGEVVTTDFRVMSGLLNLPQADLAKVNPADYADRLSESDRRVLESQVRAAITNDPAGQVGRSRTQQVSSTITQIFGEDKDMNPEERGQVDAFYALVTAEEAYRQQLKGSPLSSQEFTELLNDLSMKQVVNRSNWWPGSTEYKLDDVPAEEITPISAILRGVGKPVTGANLIEIYRQRQRMRDQGVVLPGTASPASINTSGTGPLRTGFRPTE